MNISPYDVPLSVLLLNCEPIFKKSSYLGCYVSLNTLRYFWWPTGRLLEPSEN